MVIGGLLARSSAQQSAIDARYRSSARQAMADGDFERAKVFYSRLVDRQQYGQSEDQLNWARILSASGDPYGGREALQKLAPDGKIGYEPAHRQMALQLAVEVERSEDPALLKRWSWHMQQGVRDDSAESHRLWALYHLRVGQPAEAVKRLASAAKSEPVLWLQAAALARALGDNPSAEQYLVRSVEHSQKAIEDNPLDLQKRLLMIQTLVAQGNLDLAETLLTESMRLINDPVLVRTYSDLQLVRFDQTELSDINGRLFLLGKASRLDPNNPSVYARLVRFYQQLEEEGQREKLRESLAQSIVQGNDSAFAHFALGSIFYLEQNSEDSLFHMEQAFRQAPQMLDVANNLAWLLSQKVEPDLERAEKLILSVLERQPNTVRYRDTYAAVLEAGSRWDEALIELERLLPLVSEKERRGLHKRLAIVYRNMGKEDFAKAHEAMVENAEYGGHIDHERYETEREVNR
jgi:tetratricopeptide (TPR) repeat protein